MAYQEQNMYPDLVPYNRAELTEDEELERVMKYSLITAKEDEVRRINRQLNFVADIAGAYPGASNRSIAHTSSSSNIGEAAERVGDGNISRTKSDVISNKMDLAHIARPRPIPSRESVDNGPRGRPPPPGFLASITNNIVSGNGLDSPLYGGNRGMERISSDPQIIPIPPRPRPSGPLTPDHHLGPAKEPINAIPIPARPTNRQLNNIMGSSSAVVPRCQSVPPVFTDGESFKVFDNSGNGSGSGVGQPDSDAPLIRLSPPKPSLLDWDLSLFDPCRPDKYQASASLADASIKRNQPTGPPMQSTKLPVSSNQILSSSPEKFRNSVNTGKPALPESARNSVNAGKPALPESSRNSMNAVKPALPQRPNFMINAATKSQASSGNPFISSGMVVANIAGSGWDVVAVSNSNTMPASLVTTSLQPIDWTCAGLSVFDLENEVIHDDQYDEGESDASTIRRLSQPSDLMDFSDMAADPEYMSLEDFDPLYKVKANKPNKSGTLFSIYASGGLQKDSGLNVRSKPSEIEFTNRRAITGSGQAVVAYQPETGVTVRAKEPPFSGSATLQPVAKPRPRLNSNSELSSGQTDTGNKAGINRVESLDELQDPFSIQDLTECLERKRQKHAQEQQSKLEAAAAAASAAAAEVNTMPTALQQRLTQFIKTAGKEASCYETLQDVTEASAADDETRAFLEMVARIKLLHDPNDTENNLGIVVSPRIKYTPYFDLTVKVTVSATFITEPVVFTCDVNTKIEHVVSQVLLTVVDDLASVSVNNYILKVHGLSEYTLNDSKLADYAYVQQCLKLDNDIKFVLCELDSINKPFLRTEADSSHPVFVPKMKPSGDPATKVTKNKLNILTETFYKEVEKLRDAAFKAARSGGTRVNSSGVVQAVKALCTILHQLETVDIMKSVERLKVIVHDQFSDPNESSGSTSSEQAYSHSNSPFHTSCTAYLKSSVSSMNLDDLHVILEEVTTSVKSMIEMYCRTFHTDFRFESSASSRIDRGILPTSNFHESLLIHLSTAHRIPMKWKTSHVDYRIICSLFYGGKQLSQEIISQPKAATFSAGFSTIIWDEWIVFDSIPISSIPREARIIFTLIGTKIVNSGSSAENQHKINVSLGWVPMQLFDQSFELVQGSQLLGLWPGNTMPLSTPCSCVDNPNSVLLQVNLPVFENIYIFPSVPDPLPSCRQDFNSLHPDDRTIITSIIEKDALTRLTSDESDYLWEKRYHLYDYPRALPRVLQTVNSWSWASLRETYSMIQEWAPLSSLDALPLLQPSYPDTFVREKAVEHLSQLTCDELYDLLPQLVQALKFECYHTSALAQLLLDKAGCNVRIAHHLYWLLKEAADDMIYRKRYQLMFGALLSVIGEAMRKEMTKQEDVVKMFSAIADKVKAARDKNAVLTRELRNVWEFLPQSSSLRLPLNPSLEVTGVDVKSCSYFTSFTVPLKLCLKNIDAQAGDIYAMFKVGDDLRQDMLTLQMVRIMDKLWLLEGLDLKMITFSCQPTSLKHGLVELLMESETLRKIQVNQGHGVAGSFKDRTISEWLQKHNPTELDYQKAVHNFTLSCAGYCVATYVLGICDRHNDNIMIKHSGHIFHIDFAKFLGDAQMFGNIKRDRTPFVLTSDMAYVINGGDKPTQKFQVFVDLCCRAFNILRKNSNLFLNLFSLMTLSGIPGVTADAPKYIQRVLLPDRSDAEAVAEFTRMINVSLQSIFTQFNFFLHNLAQMKFIGHDEGVLLSFIPKTYSIQTDGKIRNLELFGIQKRYSPEKFYIYIIKVERENQRVASYVMRRFSEFQELHRKLVLAFPLVRLPSLSNKVVIGRAHVRTVAESRKAEIELFLQDLLKLAPEVAQHDLIYTFFHPMLRDEQDVDKTNILKLKDAGTVNRNRSNSTNSIDGEIKLNLWYRGDTLTVMVMHVKSLGVTSSGDTPNPYVKLYLLPDPTKQTKRKTKIVHSTFHPTYNEMLIYRCPIEVLKQRTLQVTVWSYETMKENEFLGAAHIRLYEFDLSRECIAWHKLQTLHSINL